MSGIPTNKIDAFMIQIEDYIQAMFYRVYGVNEGEVELTAGTTEITFNSPYDVGEQWKFLKNVAISNDGFSIGVEVTDKSETGFNVTVDSDCTYKYRTSYLRNWITD